MRIKYPENVSDRVWHYWFAWYPCIVGYAGEGTVVWLEYVERRRYWAGLEDGWRWQYRDCGEDYR